MLTNETDDPSLMLALMRFSILYLRRTNPQCCHGWHESKGKNEGADQGQHEGGRHRLEGLTFHSLQSEDGCKHQQDDQLAESSGAHHGAGRINRDFHALARIEKSP